MKSVFVLIIFSLFCALSHGQGSGDVVVIAPTNKAAPPTDSTNDSGSGDDDEDGYGSGAKPTTGPSIVGTTIGPTDDEDLDEFSGSGSGFGFKSTAIPVADKSTPSQAMKTDSTDIYIKETSTKVVTTKAAPKPTTESTITQRKASVPSQTRSQPTKNIDTTEAVTGWRTAQPDMTTVSSNTGVPSDNVVDKTTKSDEVTVVVVQKTTVRPPTSKQQPVTEDEATEAPEKKRTTVAEEPGVLAQKGNESHEGFSLTTEVIAGVVGCAVLALLLIAFLMYRLKKRDEGSYLLDDSHGNPSAYKKVDNSDKEAFV